jgi:hypothetical protein
MPSAQQQARYAAWLRMRHVHRWMVVYLPPVVISNETNNASRAVHCCTVPGCMTWKTIEGTAWQDRMHPLRRA